MRVKHVIHHAVNVACGVIVVLFTGKFGHDFEHLLTCIRHYRCAVDCKDGRKIGGKHFEFHYIFEWFAIKKGIHVGH